MTIPLADALGLYQAGYATIRASVDGQKRPVGKWEQYQTRRPTEDQVIDWFADGYSGVGIITGAVSGNAEMLEFEGRAVQEGILATWVTLMDQAGLSELRERLRGWVEQSPTGGYHIHYRITGKPVAGNTKLARRPATDAELALNPKDRIRVLVETRGEGGFVVTAPSNGATHPSGKPWLRISGEPATTPALTADEHDALWAICRMLDAMPEPVEHSRTIPTSTAGDRPGDDYNQRADWADILDGWSRIYTHGNVTYWRRPGKTIGVSATTGRNDADNLYVFTTSTEFDDLRPYSKFAAYTLLNHHGDYAIAAKQLRADGYGADIPRPSTHVDKAEQTAELQNPRTLLDEFWTARPILDHIRQAAWSRGRSAEAVLGCILARIAADTHHAVKLPPIVGSQCGLTLITALAGPPGTGKSSSKSIAVELTPADLIDPLCDDIPPGSGEGIVDILFDLVTDDDPRNEGKKIKVKRQTRHNVFAYADEGEILAAQANRKSSSTILPTLRTVFTDGTLGQANASEERKRVVPGGSYVYGFVIGIQPEKAGPLFDDAGGGTPQRFLWSATNTPVPAPGDRPEWPGTLERKPLPRLLTGPFGTVHLTVPEHIRSEVQAKDYDKQQHGCNPLDEHAELLRLKVAAILAVLDGRHDIDDEDWALAATVMVASNATRASVLRALEDRQRTTEEATRNRRSRDAVAVDVAIERRQIVDVARKIAHKVHAQPERWTYQQMRRDFRRDRDVFVDAVDHAVTERWVTVIEEEGQGEPKRSLRPGQIKP